jgi:hypothetical protein
LHDANSWYEANNLRREKHNSPNSPELRPIERYWALLKCNVNKRSTAALDTNLFKQKVNRTVKTIDQKFVGGFKGKVRQFGRGEEI